MNWQQIVVRDHWKSYMQFDNLVLTYLSVTFFISNLGVVKVGNKKADPPADIALTGLKWVITFGEGERSTNLVLCCVGYHVARARLPVSLSFIAVAT